MSQTPIPNQFPSGDPQDLAHVTTTQVQSTVDLAQAALASMRAKYPAAMNEASIEGQAIQALTQALALLPLLLPK